MDRESTHLRRIAGIGTATARTLRESGVKTLEDLAGRPTDELAEITGKSQRTVEEWQAQARELAAAEEPIAIEPGPVEPNRQHSETFAVEVLMNKDDSVRYVRAKHLSTHARHTQEDRAETASWSDWTSAAGELAGFLEEHAGLTTQVAERRLAPEEPDAHPTELHSAAGEPAAPPLSEATESAPATHRISQVAATASLASPGGLMPSENTPFTLRLSGTLGRLGVAREGSLDYQATVVAKWLGHPQRRVVGETTGTARRDDGGFDVLVECEGLPAGTYRLETVVRLDDGGEQVVALLENTLLQVRPGP